MQAHVRRLEGWTQADNDALARQDNNKNDAVWRFRGVLGRRHKLYPSVYRFDVLDLTAAEIMRLVEVTEKAMCARDLDAVADIVVRLRLDGRVMSKSEFEAVVLRGEIAPPHRAGLARV